jgi:GntR family transcriptional regulator
MMIIVQTGSQTPIFQQIVDGISLKIATGELPVGAQLPSVRGLATLLAINSKTVAKAYNILTEQLLVEAKSGRGLFVRFPQSQSSVVNREVKLHGAINTFIATTVSLNYSNDELLKRLEDELKTVINQKPIAEFEGQK